MKRNYNDDNKSDSHRSNNINEISESKIKKYCKNYELVQDYLQNGTNLKRSTSEKSLSSSYSSSRSSFSSISMGSANSLGLNINVKNSNDPLKASNLSSKFIIDQENKTVNNLSPSSSQLDILTIEGASSISMAKRDEIVSNTSSSKKSYNFESKLSDEEVNYKSVKFRIDSDTNIRDDNLKNNINIMNKTNHFANENNDNLCNQKYTEKILEDGSVQTFFRNGTVKEVSPDKKHTTVRFFNGDRKEIDHETSTETYFYAETKITQIIHSNGYQILKFPNGQVENHHIDKTREIIFPDKIKKIIFPNGTEESYLPNGTIIKVDDKGNKVIEYPNKQREIHTKEFKRREYPDGSIKTVYSNGISETVYSNGRVRIKDSLGNIIDDKKL
jgi:centromere protein J